MYPVFILYMHRELGKRRNYSELVSLEPSDIIASGAMKKNRGRPLHKHPPGSGTP